MKKNLMAMLMVGSLISVGVAGEEYSPFAGVEFGSEKASVDWSLYGTHVGTTDRERVWGLKGGFYDSNTRVYAGFHYVDADEGDTKERWYDLTANLEATTEPYTLMGRIAASGFVGAHLGAIQIRAENSTVGYDEKGTDFVYGIQAGVNILFGRHFNMEVGARKSWSALEMDVDGVKFKLDHYYNLYAGVNYYF
ncbi:hypothetical protein [Hydrogenimonas sp.]